MTDIEDLRNLIVSITGDNSINVVLNDGGQSYTDGHTIVLGWNTLPQGLENAPQLKRRLMDGIALHEAGHCIKTVPFHSYYEDWGVGLKKLIRNIVEDKRVNHHIEGRYGDDVGKRLTELKAVLGQAWKDMLDGKGQKFSLATMVIDLIGLMGLYVPEVDTEHYICLALQGKPLVPPKQIKAAISDVQNILALLDEVKTVSDLYHLSQYNRAIYNILSKYDAPNLSQIPSCIGGTGKLVIGKEQAEQLEQQAQKEQDGEQAVHYSEGEVSVGKGTGLEIPPFEPDKSKYERYVQRNQQRIDELFNLLRKTMQQRTVRTKWQKRGRMMQEVVAKAYGNVQAGNRVQDIYEQKTVLIERQSVAIGLLVDLSGSMNTNTAIDVLTIISEVCNKWLRDEDFAILGFGTEFCKVKSFVEKYANTKHRLGGIINMSSTEIDKPLLTLHKMFNALGNHRRKILVIVSDFQVFNPDKTKLLIKNIEQAGISCVGIKVCSYVGDRFCKYELRNNGLRDLPKQFFEVYLAVQGGKV